MFTIFHLFPVDLGVGLSIIVCCFVCTYICTKLLPNGKSSGISTWYTCESSVILSPPHLLHCLGPNFGAIELDDIRIERLDDIESGLKSNIEVLKVIILLVH